MVIQNGRCTDYCDDEGKCWIRFKMSNILNIYSVPDTAILLSHLKFTKNPERYMSLYLYTDQKMQI